MRRARGRRDARRRDRGGRSGALLHRANIAVGAERTQRTALIGPGTVRNSGADLVERGAAGQEREGIGWAAIVPDRVELRITVSQCAGTGVVAEHIIAGPIKQPTLV